jgi:neutral ceramidase
LFLCFCYSPLWAAQNSPHSKANALLKAENSASLAQKTENPPSATLFPRSPLYAGVAERFLDLPLGLPLSGYTARLGMSAPDARESYYTTRFAPSIGAETRSSLKSVVLKNDLETVIFLRFELIYVADVLLFAIEDEASKRLGLDLHDKIVITATHTHSGYGSFWGNWVLYLGHDMYIPEIFQRMVDQASATIVDAYHQLQPARIGVGTNTNFDPYGEIFSDRRSYNDVLGPNGELIWGNGGKRIRHDIEPRGHTKDNRLSLIRIDDAAGNPLAAIMNFGMHPTVLEEKSLFLSGDAAFHTEWALQESFARKVVCMFVQGADGDSSPRGEGPYYFHDFQRLERLANIAAPRIKSLFESISTEPEVDLEIVSRQVSQKRSDISIIRDGKKISYGPPTEPWNFDGDYFFTYEEFNFPYGAGMCGSTCDDNPETIKGEGHDNGYLSCLDLSLGGKIIPAAFRLPPQDPPLSEYSTRISAIRLNDYLILTMPGEPISILSDMLRKAVPEPFDFNHTLVFGLAQDHEGYLHSRFDWLQGGGPEVVNFSGPLYGEYLMDQSLDLAGQLITPEKESPGGIARPRYLTMPTWKTEPYQPEVTLNAGKIYQDYQSLGDKAVKTIERFENATVTWLGGDPTIDWPKVTLQKEVDGEFQDVLLASGRPLTDAGPEIFLRYNPYPIEMVFREREHRWTADWETVKDTPTGVYRFLIEGVSYDGQDKIFPFEGIPYTIESAPFRVAPSSRIRIANVYLSVIDPKNAEVHVEVAYPANPQMLSSSNNIFVENDTLLRMGEMTFDEGHLLSYRVRDFESPPFLPAPVRHGVCGFRVEFENAPSSQLETRNLVIMEKVMENAPDLILPLPDMTGERIQAAQEKIMEYQGESGSSFFYNSSNFEMAIEVPEGIDTITKVSIPAKGIMDEYGNYNGISW